MKYRHHAEHQVALLGLTPAWYLKHNPEIAAILREWEARDPAV